MDRRTILPPALPTGRYSVIVRQSARTAKECQANLRGNESAVLDLGLCKAIRIDPGVRKGGPSARMVSGAVSARASNTGSNIWQPMSPNVPVPKSSRLRHSSG